MERKIKGVIFDIDGVLVYQDHVLNGAIETINILKKHGYILRYLSNSTLSSRKSRADKLKSLGFQISENEIITASYATAMYIKRIKPRSFWLMLEGKGLDEFKGFTQNTEDPEYIVMGNDRNCFNFDTMNKALKLLLGGTKLIAMMEELVDSSQGDLELDVGSWAKMLEIASGVKATYIGKPNRFIFELTLDTMNLDNQEIIMVGDRINTDIKGANDIGIRSLLVKTGEFKDEDLDCDIKPDFKCETIQEITRILSQP